MQELNVVLKADTQGSLESLQASLDLLHNDEVAVKVVSSAVGDISESDVAFAKTAGALLIGFNVSLSSGLKALANRELYVGAVDLDSGEFVAFNLGGYLRASPTLSDKVVGCYATAVLASSSVPMAALPVFIDGRVYVDGGARNGMFGMQLINQLYELAASGGADPASAPNLYLLVNGTQVTEPDCDGYRKQKIAPAGPSAAQDAFCRKTVGDPHVTPPKRPTWSLATVGLRSVDVLINQVYRANAQATFQAYQLAFHTQTGFHFTRMKPDAPDFRLGDRSCGSSAGYVTKDGQPTWFDLDEQATHPLEFYPHYMKCLIAYGEERARQEAW